MSLREALHECPEAISKSPLGSTARSQGKSDALKGLDEQEVKVLAERMKGGGEQFPDFNAHKNPQGSC